MEIKKHKPLVYLCGSFNGPEYYKAFEDMEDELTSLGRNPMSPARLPNGLTTAQRHRITAAMIDSADAVVMIPGWQADEAAVWEHHLAYCFDRPIVELREGDPFGGEKYPESIVHAWLRHDLKEVLRHE